MGKSFFPVLVMVLLMITSCYEDNKAYSPLPEKLLSQQQMIDVLTELQLVEGRVVLERDKNKDIRNTGQKYNEEVYNAFGITIHQLIENLDYYQDHTDVMVDIYDGVLANITQLQTDVKLRIAHQKRSDRIRTDDKLLLIQLKKGNQQAYPVKVDYLKPGLTFSDYFENTATLDSVSIPLSSW